MSSEVKTVDFGNVGRWFLAIALAMTAGSAHVWADVQIEKRPHPDQSITILQGANIEPDGGWHYLMTNPGSRELTVMLEIFISYGPEDELSRTIVFTTNRALIHLGVGFPKATETQSHGIQYEFQLYILDDKDFKSERVRTIPIERMIDQRSENYVDAIQSCQPGRRYVLGDFTVTSRAAQTRTLGSLVKPDRPVDSDTGGFDAKIAVSIFEKQ